MYSAAGETPIATRLASFTQVRGLAFGNYAEVSPDVEDLILQCGHASTGEAVGRATTNEAEARSWWVSHCRMRIGVATARACVRYRLKRLVLRAPLLRQCLRARAWPHWRMRSSTSGLTSA